MLCRIWRPAARDSIILDEVTRNLCSTLLLAFSLLIPAGTRAQEPETAPLKAVEPSGDIFSGTVMQFSEQSLTVVRKVAGQTPGYSRVFARWGYDSGREAAQ